MMSLPDPLRMAYESTEYWVDDVPGGPFAIRCGARCLLLDRLLVETGVTDWAYITACNPDSRLLSDQENVSRMVDLESRLRAEFRVIYHGRGIASVGDWPPEASLLVLGMTESEGRKFGLAFGQRAIVVGTLNQPARIALV